MDKNAVLSLSPDKDALASREVTLRNGGMKVISVMTPIQARFEIEMGRCGIFLICYRLSETAADELTKLFRNYCPEGRIVFVTKPSEDDQAPVETDIRVPESSGPEQILRALRQNIDSRAAA